MKMKNTARDPSNLTTTSILVAPIPAPIENSHSTVTITWREDGMNWESFISTKYQWTANIKNKRLFLYWCPF